jgi:hypothetical protein
MPDTLVTPRLRGKTQNNAKMSNRTPPYNCIYHLVALYVLQYYNQKKQEQHGDLILVMNYMIKNSDINNILY